MKKQIIGAVCLFATGLCMAQDAKIQQLDSVLIDTKTTKARKNSGKVISVIDAKMLEQSAGESVAEIINRVSGIEINGSRSNAGQNLAYQVRGGRNRQVVIMIDGVQVSDPSQIANDYDLRLIPSNSLEKIEIIKGASSVLYGSGAATAVISLTTKGASNKSISGSFTSTASTNRAANDDDSDLEEFTNNVAVNGTLGKFFYNTSFSHRTSNGLSAIAAPEGELNFEEDSFNRFSTRVNVGYRFSDKFTVSRFFSQSNFKAEFDDFSFTDADNLSVSEEIRTGGELTWNHKKLIITLRDNHGWLDRNIESSFPSKFDSQTSSFDGFATYRINNQFQVVGGVNGTFSSFNSFTIPFGASEFNQDVDEDTAKFDIIDPYVNVSYISDFGLQLNAGARLNNHSNYGSHLVYNVNPSYGFDFGKNRLKVLASYSTAFITPSLFQLYDPQFGNEALEPEENTTLEGGLEFTSEANLRISAVYFNRDESSFVDFVTVDPDNFIFQYQNIGESFTASGVEVEVFKRFGEHLTFSANYTNTQADEKFALRIPEHKANASLGYSLNTKTNFGLSYQYVGEREDAFFNSDTFETENITLESFGLLGFRASHEFSDHIKVFAGISNLLDEEYEELYRFQTRGRNVRLGFSLNF